MECVPNLNFLRGNGPVENNTVRRACPKLNLILDIIWFSLNGTNGGAD